MTTEPSPTPDAHAAIEALVDGHGAVLYSLGLRICGSPQDAEEMVQETFLNALRGWGSFEGRSKPTTWLYTIARRVCQRMHRPRAGQPERFESLEELLPGRDATVADFEAAGPDRDQLRREAITTVERAIAELPLDFRMALVLVDIAELSLAEAAEVLDIPNNTVKTRVHRARLRLRRTIDEGLPQKTTPAPTNTEVCRSLLQAKLDALDREVEFPYADAALCERCASVFAALDLGQDACLAIGKGKLPPKVAERLRASLAAAG